ncbi:uncharacterized protein LOC132394485 isoform X2 [Hypanus sabinus]|uniref:uncharacterized protein LOC132394485 isoform X2 n=1 Tax=Hypanus sabinus TaxID=79690 RepID=UPI0028C4DAB0|nr:uncharacterized protein LOC132394485 isoform X2 [Hypanus sabinus]
MLLCVFFLVLSVPFATAVKQRICGIVGQAVFLNPGYLGDISKNETLWIFIHGNKNSVNILDYYPGRSTEYPNGQFNSRLQYNASSGGMRVLDLRPEDQGNFIFRVNGKDKSTVNLIVNSKLTNNLTRSNSNIASSTIQLSCEIARCILEYQWQKDGKEIPQRYQLVDNNRRLVIPSALKNDCGTYTCIANSTDRIVQEKYTLIIYGFIWADYLIVGAAIIGLVVSSISHVAWWILQKKQRNQVFQRLLHPLIICIFLTLVTTIIVLIFWIGIKGADFLVVVALTTISSWFLIRFACCVNLKLSCLFAQQQQKEGLQSLVGLDTTVVIPISLVILKKEIQQSGIRNNESNMADAERLGDNGALQS